MLNNVLSTISVWEEIQNICPKETLNMFLYNVMVLKCIYRLAETTYLHFQDIMLISQSESCCPVFPVVCPSARLFVSMLVKRMSDKPTHGHF